MRVQRTLRSSSTSKGCKKKLIFNFKLRKKLRLSEETTLFSSSKFETQIFISGFNSNVKCFLNVISEFSNKLFGRSTDESIVNMTPDVSSTKRSSFDEKTGIGDSSSKSASDKIRRVGFIISKTGIRKTVKVLLDSISSSWIKM